MLKYENWAGNSFKLLQLSLRWWHCVTSRTAIMLLKKNSAASSMQTIVCVGIRECKCMAILSPKFRAFMDYTHFRRWSLCMVAVLVWNVSFSLGGGCDDDEPDKENDTATLPPSGRNSREGNPIIFTFWFTPPVTWLLCCKQLCRFSAQLRIQ